MCYYDYTNGSDTLGCKVIIKNRSTSQVGAVFNYLSFLVIVKTSSMTLTMSNPNVRTSIVLIDIAPFLE